MTPPVDPVPTTTDESRRALALLAEKVAWTFVQMFLAVLAAGSALDASTAEAAFVAAVAAALTALANGLPLVPDGLPFALDLILRGVRTFVAGFVSLLVADGVVSLSLTSWRAAAVGAFAMVIAFIKGEVAGRIGEHGTPATLPASLDRAADVAPPAR